jgi:hypothetical protein
MSADRAVLALKKEGGKSVTAQASGADVALIFWRKNGGVLLPLVLSRMEALKLRDMLDDAAFETSRKP